MNSSNRYLLKRRNDSVFIFIFILFCFSLFHFFGRGADGVANVFTTLLEHYEAYVPMLVFIQKSIVRMKKNNYFPQKISDSPTFISPPFLSPILNCFHFFFFFWIKRENECIIYFKNNSLVVTKGHTYLNKPTAKSCRFFLRMYELGSSPNIKELNLQRRNCFWSVHTSHMRFYLLPCHSIHTAFCEFTPFESKY